MKNYTWQVNYLCYQTMGADKNSNWLPRVPQARVVKQPERWPSFGQHYNVKGLFSETPSLHRKRPTV